jgi:hypothetical protein
VVGVDERSSREFADRQADSLGRRSVPMIWQGQSPWAVEWRAQNGFEEVAA